MSKYLIHHGIKGQNWGVKHGPPYPLDAEKHRTVIKKGNHLKRLTVNDESNKKGSAYVTINKSDSNRYKGFFSANLRRLNRGKDVLQIDMTAKEDLISPSRKERVDAFIELYKNDKNIGKELGEYYKENWHYFSPGTKKHYEKKFSNLSDEELTTTGYKVFASSLGAKDYTRSKYFESLKNKGFNMVIDDLDAGKYGKEPAILFEREKSTKFNGNIVVDKKESKEIWKKEGTKLKKYN